MYSPGRHLDYDIQRRADLIRDAGRRDLALRVAASRDDERRSFLVRAWQQRFGRAVGIPEPAPVAGQ